MSSIVSIALLGSTAQAASMLLAPAARGQELAVADREHQEESEEEEDEEIIVQGTRTRRRVSARSCSAS